MSLTRRFCVWMLTSAILVLGVGVLSAAERVRWRLDYQGKTVVLDFQQVADKDDRTRLDGKPADFKFKTHRDELFAQERELYLNTGYTAAPDGATFNGYDIGYNLSSYKQICGGLALARLIGGPYKLPTEQATKVVETFGKVIPEAEAQPGDVVVWRQSAGGSIQHFAVVWQRDGNGQVVVASKDGPERVLTGLADQFPAKKKGYGPRSYYRLDWSAIRVTKLGMEYTKGRLLAGPVSIMAKKSEPTDLGVVLTAGTPYIIVGEGVCSLWDRKDMPEGGCDSVFRYSSPLISGGGDLTVWGQLKLINPNVHLCEAWEEQLGRKLDKKDYKAGHRYEAVVFGEGKSIKAIVHDGGSYSDNAGTLKVSVYEAVPITR